MTSDDNWKAQLRPVLVDQTFLPLQELRFQALGVAQFAPVAAAAVGADLVKCLCIQSNTGQSLLRTTQLEKWDVSFDAALEAAIDNIDAGANWPRLTDSGMLISDCNDGYDGARLLLLQRMLNRSAAGELVALVPARAKLLMAPATHESALAHMAKVAYKIIETGEHRISAQPVVLDAQGQWTPFSLPLQLAELYRPLWRRLAQRHYNEQRQWLERLLRQRREPGTVPEVHLHERPRGNLLLTAAWPRELPALLPKVDQISFMDAKRGQVRLAHWGHVKRSLPHYLESTSWVPERWRVTGYPSERELRSLETWVET